MKKFFFILLVLPVFASAQNGIDFVHGMSWKDIQAKARAENKYIFVDGWTTWCGPCVYMAANIFPLEPVGKFFNDKFINVKMQLDTSKKDNDEVKSHYQDAHDLMEKYSINVFPTYLFFDPNGKLVHRAVGATPEYSKFIAKATDALNPDKQYYTLLDKYKAGKKEPEFLKQLAIAAQEAADEKVSSKTSAEYLLTQKDLTTADNIEFVSRFTTKSKDPGFKILVDNADAYDKVKGAGAAAQRIIAIALQEEVYPKIFNGAKTPPNWSAISKAVNEKYRQYAQEILATGKVTFFQRTGDWMNFQVAIIDYMKNYGATTNAAQLNDFAWAVFENCNDLSCVKEALEWSKRSLKTDENGMYLDTYANLLYKLGNKDEAIKAEEKAITLVSEAEKPDYQATLDKMKKGEKTWKD